MIQRLGGRLWVLPVLAAMVAIVLLIGLSLLTFTADSPAGFLLFQGAVDEARRLQLAIATTLVGVFVFIIGLTVVAIQVAANRYSPRLLRHFLRDRATQIVVSVFVFAFAYNAMGLFVVGIHFADAPGEFPRFAVSVGLALVFVCLVAVLYFIDHVVHSIQIDHLLARVGTATKAAIGNRPPGVGGQSGRAALPPAPAGAMIVPARRTGYFQRVDITKLVAAAAQHDLVIRMIPQVGDHVVAGHPLAKAWYGTGDPAPGSPADAAKVLDGSVVLGFERTMDSDIDLGLLQIVDMATLSIHIKDFYTPVQAANEMSDVLCLLAAYNLGDEVCTDEAGKPRVVVPAPTFAEYVDIACGKIRRFAVNETLVATALLRMLGAVMTAATDEEKRAAVIDHIGRVVADAERAVPNAADLDQVHREAERALGGRALADHSAGR